MITKDDNNGRRLDEARAKQQAELCGIEFFSRKRYKEFIRLNPLLQDTVRLTARNHFMVVMTMKDFPTRDISEFYDSDGRVIGKFIGPDALEWTYQIRIEMNIDL